MTEKIDRNHTIRFESPLPLPNFDFNTLNGNRKTLPPGEPQNRITLRLPPFEDLLSVDLDTKEFLGRTTYSVGLSSPHFPEEIEVILTSAEEVTLYDSDFPATLRSDRSGVLFHIGRNPAFPFTFSFTVPRELEGNLTVTADYHTPPYDLGIDQEKFEVDYTLTASISSAIPPIAPPTDPAEEKREEEKEQLTPSTP